MQPIDAAALMSAETFAANRATGHITLSVASAFAASRRTRLHEAGSLRVRFPHGRDAGQLDAVIVNTAGGVTGGDRFDLGIDVGTGARLTVTTAAAEKVYRSLGPETESGVRMAVEGGAALAWLPQETILFDRARLRRTIEVDLAADARLLLAEAIVFGRTAMGEVVHCGRLVDCWRVRVGGALLFAETMRVADAVAENLSQPAIAAGDAAIASVFKFPSGDEDVAGARALQHNFAGEVGISAWNGFAVARLVAPDGAVLRHDLIALLTLWGGGPLPRLWLN